MKQFFSFLLLSLLTISCSVKYETKGHMIEERDLKQISINATEHDVENILGSPTSKSVFGNETWYYIGYEAKITPLTNPMPTHYDALIIEFANGKVKNIKDLKKQPFHMIKPITETTPVKGKDSSLIGDFMSNIGKYSGGDKKEKAPTMPSNWD